MRILLALVLVGILIQVNARSIEFTEIFKEKPANGFIPNNFDLRFSYGSAKCFWDSGEESLCYGQNWALTITNVVANT